MRDQSVIDNLSIRVSQQLRLLIASKPEVHSPVGYTTR